MPGVAAQALTDPTFSADGTAAAIYVPLIAKQDVITSAGVVLAATFTVLGVLPLVFLAELGFAVAFGVLLDTFIVRTVLVLALSYDIGPTIWWPSKLSSTGQPLPNPGGTAHPTSNRRHDHNNTRHPTPRAPGSGRPRQPHPTGPTASRPSHRSPPPTTGREADPESAPRLTRRTTGSDPHG